MTTTDAEKAMRFKPGPDGRTLVDTKVGDSFADRLDLGLYGAHGQTLQALNRLAAELEELRAPRLPTSKPIRFREHRGSLEDSMATCVDVADMSELHARLFQVLGLPKGKVTVTPYARDERIDWLDTHVVHIEGYGVAGFTSGMPKVE